jgi:hypothetical protein
MTRDLTLEAQVQQVLNELWREKLIPFALNVGKITKADKEYTIHFYDSRITNASVSLIEGHALSDLIRSAVLNSVAKISGERKRPRYEV